MGFRAIDPQSALPLFFDDSARWIYEGSGVGPTNRYLNDMLAGLSARNLLGPALEGKTPGLWRKHRIERALIDEGRLQPDVARRLAEGKGTPDEYNAAIRRMSANLSSGGLRAGEKSWYENQRWWGRLTAFTRYPQTVVRDTATKVSSGVREMYRATEPGISRTPLDTFVAVSRTTVCG